MAMVGVTESCKGLVAGDESHADAREIMGLKDMTTLGGGDTHP